jgi:hypothetical protein
MAAPLLALSHMRKNLLLAGILVLATVGPSWSQGRTAQPRGGERGGGERARPAQAPADRGGDRRGGGGGGGMRDNQPSEPRRATPAERTATPAVRTATPSARTATPSERTERRGSGELPRVYGSAFAEGMRAAETDGSQRRLRAGTRYAVPRIVEPGQEVRRYVVPDGRQNGLRYDAWDRRPGGRKVYNNNHFYVAPGRYYAYRPPRAAFYHYSPYPRYRYDNRVFGWYGGVVGYGGYGGYGFGYPTGELRLDVQPPWAQVYVDGYYAGTVDDFDGFGQGLRLEEGSYTIEIVAPGFEPLSVDVRIERGRQITYEGDLIPEGGPAPRFESEP